MANQKLFPYKEKELIIENFTITQGGVPTESLDSDRPFEISMGFETLEDLTQFRLGVYVKNSLGNILFRSLTSDWKPELEKIKKGRYHGSVIFPGKLLMPGNYFLSVHAGRFGIINYTTKKSIDRSIVVSPSAYYNQAHPNERAEAALLLEEEWVIKSDTGSK